MRQNSTGSSKRLSAALSRDDIDLLAQVLTVCNLKAGDKVISSELRLPEIQIAIQKLFAIQRASDRPFAGWCSLERCA